MKRRPLITLTTDFGAKDSYAAAMKGVIYSICKNAKVIDLSHELDTFNIFNCAFFLAGCITYFPENSIHIIVVDPGVGSKRFPAAVKIGSRYFICPDNGVLTLLLKQEYKAYRITNNRFILPSISNTFNGRDIFAPAAAHLANGHRIEKMGEVIDKLVTIKINESFKDTSGNIIGEIVYIDNFGNCISNIHMNEGKNYKKVKTKDIELSEIKNTYIEEANGMPIAIWGSSGYLELAANMSSAEKLFNIKIGDKIVLYN